MASNCVCCHKRVAYNSKALQCATCDGWVHIVCCQVAPELYKCIQAFPAPGLNFLCERCKPFIGDARAKAGLLSASPTPRPASVKDNLPSNVVASPTPTTPVENDGTSRNTPPASPVRKVTNARDGVPASPIRSYATVAAASLSSNNKLDDVQPPVTKNKKKPENLHGKIESVMLKVSELEELLKKQPQQSQVSVNQKVPQSRNRSLIILNAPESRLETSADGIHHDTQFLERMVSLLFDEGEPAIKVELAFRLGRKNEDPLKPRPLKVILEEEEQCRRVLKRTFRLKGESFFVVRDLSPEDRIRMREAVKELKERRTKGETNLQIVDFRVVKREPKVRWKPVLLTPHCCNHPLESN